MNELPVAKWTGVLKFGERELDCYVLDNGKRTLSQRGMMLALTGVAKGADEFLGSKALKGLIRKDFVADENLRFTIPTTNTVAVGVTAKGFIEVCCALADAAAVGKLSGEAQRRAGVVASIVLRSCAAVGITALVDEATGYQIERAPNALQVLVAAYIAEETRKWELMFERRYYYELDRLCGFKRTHPNKHPSIYGVVTDKIYQLLDPEVADHLRSIIPRPTKGGPKRHQQLTDFGRQQLRDVLMQELRCMETCSTLREYLWYLDEKISRQQRLPFRLTNVLVEASKKAKRNFPALDA